MNILYIQTQHQGWGQIIDKKIVRCSQFKNEKQVDSQVAMSSLNNMTLQEEKGSVLRIINATEYLAQDH